MELKEYLGIIKKQLSLFLLIISVVVCGTFSYFIFRPVAFDVSLFLNITRSGKQIVSDYKYDDFYRLQADEKFAETLVGWLKSPRIVFDINEESHGSVDELSLRQLRKKFQAEKMSSQIVAINFSTANEKMANDLSDAIVKVLIKNTDQLNENQKEDAWFEIKAQKPLIIKKSFDSIIVFLASFIVGLFLAFWIVLFKHYLK